MHVMTQETTDMQTAHEKRLRVVYGSDHPVMTKLTKQHAPASPIVFLKRSARQLWALRQQCYKPPCSFCSDLIEIKMKQDIAGNRVFFFPSVGKLAWRDHFLIKFQRPNFRAAAALSSILGILLISYQQDKC